MTRFGFPSTLTALALVMAAATPAVAQESGPSEALGYIPEEPAIPLHELIPSEADEAAAADLDPSLTNVEGDDDDFADLPLVPPPDLAIAPSASPAGAAPTLALDPNAPAAVIPPGWEMHTHFGLSFALPPEFTRDEYENDASSDMGLMVSYAQLDRATFTGQALTVGFVPQEIAEELLDSFSSQFGIGDPETLETAVRIAGLSYVEHRASGMASGGMALSVRILLGETPGETRFRPIIVLIQSNMAPDAAQAIEAQYLASFSIPDSAILGQPDPEGFRDGLMTYRILPGWRRAGGISPDFQWITLDDGSGLTDAARIVLADLGTQDWSMSSFFTQDFRTGPSSITDGTLDGVPIWIVQGQPAFTLNGAQRTTEGDAWRRYSVITQLCLPERGPLAASLITTEDRMTRDLIPENVFAGLRLHLPPAAAPCPATVTDAVVDAMFALGMPVAVAPGLPDPTLQPSDGPAPPPAPMAVVPDAQPLPPPVVDALKPDATAPSAPTPTADPEAEAWAQLTAQPSVDATYAFVQAWPESTHADHARRWLIERGIVPPGMTWPAPQDGTGPQPQTADARAFAQAEAQNTAAAYWTYLKAFPQGAFADLAFERLGIATRL